MASASGRHQYQLHQQVYCLLQMEKTEKTMAELEIDQNVKFEWDSITEAGAALKPLSGPGCAVGL
jgi:hypothetical protein